MVALILSLFAKHEGSLTCSKKPATVHCPEPEDPGPPFHPNPWLSFFPSLKVGLQDVCMYVSLFQLSIELTNLHEIRYEHFAIRVHPKAAHSSFIQSAYFHITAVNNIIYSYKSLTKLMTTFH
jgi:hypothetical protein